MSNALCRSVIVATVALAAGAWDDAGRDAGASRDFGFGGWEAQRLQEAMTSRANAGHLYDAHESRRYRNSAEHYRNKRDVNQIKKNHVPGSRDWRDDQVENDRYRGQYTDPGWRDPGDH